MPTIQLSGGSFSAKTRFWPAGGFQDTWWDSPDTLTLQWRQANPTLNYEVTVNDRIYDRVDGGVLVSDYVWPITRPDYSKNTDTIINTSNALNAIVPSLSNPALFSYVGDGKATLTRSSLARSKSAVVYGKTSPSTPIDNFNRYVAGSLRSHMHNSINGLLIGKNPATDKRIWTVQDHAALNYIRNPSCWVYDVNLTCLTPYNTSTGTSLGATLFTPLHVLQCRHAPLGVGAVINFVTLGGVVYQRTLVSNTVIGASYETLTCDLVVGRLDSPLPESIKPAYLLPDNWASYVPDIIGPAGITFPPNECRFPGFVLDQQEEVNCKDYIRVTNDSSYIGAEAFQISHQPSLNPTRVAFNKNLVSGDSGNPCFWLVNNQPVLVSVHTGPSAGTFVNNFISEINAVTQLSGYLASRVDLSMFPSY